MQTDITITLSAILLLATGTYLFRFAGPKLGAKLQITPKQQQLFSDASLLLLITVATLASFYEGQDYAGHARLIGALSAVILTLLRAPFLIILFGATATTACLRLIGIT